MASNTYALGRGYIPAMRLNLQHYLWKETLGYSVHPSVPLQREKLRIADVGTGTGIWLFDLVNQMPRSTTFHGFDISPAQYPQNDFCADNVKLQTLNAMQEPPEKLVGRYDIVHVRLFLAVVNNDDPSPLLDHCIKLLRPGGVLQWDEFDPSGHQTVSTKGSQSKNLEKLSQYVKSTKPVRWVTNLPQTFQAHGLDVIALATQREHPWQRAMYMETWSVLAEEFASNFLDIHGPLGSGDELRQLAQRAYEEVKQGSSISQVLQVVVGRKPGGEHLGM